MKLISSTYPVCEDRISFIPEYYNYNQDMNDLVFIGENRQAITTSLRVAKEFNKKHKHVIEKIKEILMVEKSAMNLFEPTTYISSRNRKEPMYVMNRDGFTLLAMGFTGKEAMKFKMDFINAFNQMEDYIRGQQQPTAIQPMTQVQALLQSVQLMADIEQKQIEQEKQLEYHSQEIETLKQTVDNFVNESHAQLELFKELPLSTNEVPKVNLRTQIVNAVALYAENTKAENTRPDYQFAWRFFYKQFQDRYHRRPIEDKSKNITKLDWLQKKGLLQPFYDLVSFYIKQMQ